MGDIKSAREIALEKLAQIEEASPEERQSWKYVPEGEKLAVKYLKEDVNLLVDITRYPEDIRKYVITGATDVLTRNILLPRNDAIKKTNRRAMDGLKIIKADKARTENVFSQIRRLFAHYIEQGQKQKEQAYAAFKTEFQGRMQEAMRQQMGTTVTNYNIDVEKQPQFIEEWQRMSAQLDGQYIKVLDQYKEELKAIH